MDKREDRALRTDAAATDITNAIMIATSTYHEQLAGKYGIDEQLTNLAIAKASVKVAVDAAARAAGLTAEQCMALEQQLNHVIYEAMREVE